jgi:hypothetical protein
MSYKIGNTVVIDNNAALGSISGNSLNLANNANISGGGTASLYTSTTPGATAGIGSSTTLFYAVGGGGGGGGNTSRNNSPNVDFSRRSGGAGAPMGMFVADTSSLSSVDITIGAGGNGVSNNTLNPGGASTITTPDFTVIGFGGLQAVTLPNNVNTLNNSTPNRVELPGTSPGFGADISGSPGQEAKTGNPPQTANIYQISGSSMFSGHNAQTGSPNYVPGNNFGFGQGAISMPNSAGYINTPGNMTGPNSVYDANIEATDGCVLLIGF